MPIFETVDSLAKYIKFTTIDEIQTITARFSNQMLYEQIKNTVYKSPEREYERTESMLDSIGSDADKLTIGKHTSYVETYPKPQDMDYSYPSVLPFSSQDNRNSIVNWLNNGHKGIWNYKGKHFMEKAQTQVNKRLMKHLKLYLESKGYVIPK
jgi:hypothetical protein